VRVDVEKREQRLWVEALWALGALEPDAMGWDVVEGVPKTAPQRRRFLPQVDAYGTL
jgi:hypothetical protein